MSIGIRVRGGRARFLAILLAIVIAFPITVSGGVASAQDPPDVSPQLVELARERALAPDRLESSLAQLAAVRAEKGTSAAKDFGEMRSLEIAADTVEVIITAQRAQAKGVETRLESIGAKSTGSYEDLVRADVPIEKLEWLSGQPEVLFVRPPQKPTVYPITGAAVADLGEADVTLAAPAGVAIPVTPAAVVSPAATVMLDDGFELWPGPWTAYGSPTWGRTSYDSSVGTYSAYCAQSTISAPGPYASDMDAWLVAGPFDFDTVSEAVLTFDYRTDFEDTHDTLFVGFSSDASNFTGSYVPAHSSGWQAAGLDMPSAVANQPNVWVAFAFRSNSSVTYEGAYIDEVTLSTGPGSTLHTSEGVAETNADVVQAGGIDGTGVKVGILDGGFAGYTTKLGTELPASVTCWGGSDLGPEGNGTQVHGTAVAETVHDMAPGASLYLAQFSDEVDFANAAAWMVSQGVDVINMSAGWSGFNPGDGTGVVNDIVDGTVASGIFWANSAGNNRERHWMGDFADGNADDVLEWDGADHRQEFYAFKGQPIEGTLCWDDVWGAAEQDYDLYLEYYDSDGAVWTTAGFSWNVQDGSEGKDPVEYIGLYAPEAGTYAWVVAKWSATRADVSFDFFDTWRNLEYPVYARSICTPADNGGAGFMAVGALGRSPGFIQESYSSEGPTRDGRLSPEIAGPSNTSNSVYEYFAGTSASSPHVAGAAALILQANPTYEPADVEVHLEGDAIDLGDEGADTQFGAGRLWVDVGSTPPENQAPVAVDDEYSTDRNETLQVPAPGVLGNDSDPDDDPISAIKVADPSDGSLTLDSDGSFTYEPDAGFIGSDSFTYRATDGDLPSNLVTVNITVNDAPTTYVPVAGTSRYDTAIKTSREAFADGTADCVVIATGANWPDALGGAALAAAKNGPILLTYPTTLYAGISGEIDRLGATEAVILGGTGAVSLDVENALRTKLGYSNVTRIGGSSRYQTAELIAAAAVAELNSAGGYDGTAFVATGANFPDALAASPLAAANGWPIFLSAPTGTPPVGVMQGLGVTDALILGGNGVVSPTQELALHSVFPGHVTRLAGTDRYATGVAIATYGVDHAGLGWDGMAIATGQNFPDALAGGVLTGRNGSVMLLTASTWLPTPVAERLTENRDVISTVYYLGGTSAVSQSVRDTITGLLR